MRSAGEALEHLLRLLGARRLPVDAAVEDDLGVAAEHRPAVGRREHRARLADGVRDRIVLRLLVLGRDDVERDTQQLENLAPPRRGRR